MANKLEQQNPQFFELNGTALNDGYVYIGVNGLNPETNPIPIFLDGILTTPIAQPLRTTGGYIYYNGNPISIYFDESDYSITVKNSLNSLIYTNLSNVAFSNTKSLDTIEDLATYTGSGLVMVKDINRGGTFVSKTAIEINPHTGQIYSIDDGTVFARLGGGFWARQYNEAVNVKWFNAKGDGVTDDTLAIQKTLNFAKEVKIPSGKFLITDSLIVPSFTTIYGEGRSAIFPYNSSTYENGYKTEIVLSHGFVAFNCINSNTSTIKGIAIKSNNGGVSAYGSPANYVSNSIGISIEGTLNFIADNIGFYGLDNGVSASVNTDLAEASFAKISNFIAEDCNVIFNFGNASSSSYIGRDIIINGCDIALHCNQMMNINKVDGLRIENCRFFQAYGESIEITNSPFVTISSVTIFESLERGLKLVGCKYISASSLTISRSGGYKTTTPWSIKTALYIENCEDASIQGVIERPGGKAVDIIGSTNINLNLALSQPYYTNGNLSTNGVNGAITVLTSSIIVLNCTLNSFGIISYSVTSDFESFDKIFGIVNSDTFTNTARPIYVANPLYSVKYNIPADLSISSLGSTSIVKKKVFVPNGKTLRTRMVHINTASVVLRSSSLFWNTNLINEANGGSTSFENKTIITNNTGVGAYYTIDFSLYNPTGSIVSVPAGTELLVSLSIQ